MNLRREGGPPLVIGHRGAAALAPENTLAALSAAVAAGVELVEFDVGASLVLGHSARELPATPISLDDALAFLRAHGVGAHIDLKDTDIEEEIVAAIRRHDLTGQRRRLERLAKLAARDRSDCARDRPRDHVPARPARHLRASLAALP